MSEHASGRPVTIGLAPGDPRAELIVSVAERLGVRRAEGAPIDGRSTIGDVVVPAEADEWLVEAAIVRALEPRHVLFLCVANSARSQLAEGIARDLVQRGGSGGGDVPRGSGPRPRISSAGSVPTSVRPQAVAVLAEIGIDISGQRSTGVDDVDGAVDTVITLCAEEVCPVWLGDAFRLHWGLPDPAAMEGSEEEKLDAFRGVRDELRRRLGVLFTGRPL